MRHPPVRSPIAGCMTLNGRVTPTSSAPARPSLAPQKVRLAFTVDQHAQAAWEAHVDAGRIGVVGPRPAAEEYGLASLATILGGTPGGVW